MNILPYNKKFFYSTIPIRKMVLKLRNNFPYLFCNLLTKKIHGIYIYIYNNLFKIYYFL